MNDEDGEAREAPVSNHASHRMMTMEEIEQDPISRFFASNVLVRPRSRDGFGVARHAPGEYAWAVWMENANTLERHDETDFWQEFVEIEQVAERIATRLGTPVWSSSA